MLSVTHLKSFLLTRAKDGTARPRLKVLSGNILIIILKLVIRLDFVLHQSDLGDHGFIHGGR